MSLTTKSSTAFGTPPLNGPSITPLMTKSLAWMAVETMIARQITYFSAREKDLDKRCDIEAGMAKLLAARVAWSNADNAVQIHGGTGYFAPTIAERLYRDAKLTEIYEGTSEIQRLVISRALIDGANS